MLVSISKLDKELLDYDLQRQPVGSSYEIPADLRTKYILAGFKVTGRTRFYFEQKDGQSDKRPGQKVRLLDEK